MTTFKQFQKDIKALGGIWEGESVYFSQFLKGYFADYRPYYPESSDKDISIALYSPFNRNRKQISIYVGNHKGDNLKILYVETFADIPDAFINKKFWRATK